MNHSFDRCFCPECQSKSDQVFRLLHDDDEEGGLVYDADNDVRVSGQWFRVALHVDAGRMEALNAWNWDKVRMDEYSL